MHLLWTLMACREPEPPTDGDADNDADADADTDADADADADTDADTAIDPYEVPLDTAEPGFGLSIVEVLADPVLDANCDGVADAGDPFLELVNVGTIEVDLGGSTVEHRGAQRLMFPLGTVVPPGGVVLVFDGGTPGFGVTGTEPWCGALPPDVQVFVAERPMELPPCGEFRLDLAGPIGFFLDLFRWEDEACRGQSLVRDPELTREAPITWHGDLHGTPTSPGTRGDGSAFQPG